MENCKQELTSRRGRDNDNRHICIVWRKMQAKGIKPSIQHTSCTNNNALHPCLFLQSLLQLLYSIPLKRHATLLRSINLPIVVSYPIKDQPPIPNHSSYIIQRIPRLQILKSTTKINANSPTIPSMSIFRFEVFKSYLFFDSHYWGCNCKQS